MKDNASTGYENAHLDIPGNPSTAKSSVLQLNQRHNNEPLNLLTEAQWTHWQQHGYVVIKAAVPKEQAQATADFLWEFEEKKADDPSTWYTQARAEMKMKELAGTGMVEVYNHQCLWNNRQTEKV